MDSTLTIREEYLRFFLFIFVPVVFISCYRYTLSFVTTFSIKVKSGNHRMFVFLRTWRRLLFIMQKDWGRRWTLKMFRPEGPHSERRGSRFLSSTLRLTICFHDRLKYQNSRFTLIVKPPPFEHRVEWFALEHGRSNELTGLKWGCDSRNRSNRVCKGVSKSQT